MLWWIVLACGSDPVDSAGLADEASAPCDEEDRADVLEPGLVADSGSLVVAVVEASPMPPLVGDNDWTVSLVDDAGVGVPGCIVEVIQEMPDHGHGAAAPTVEDVGGGQYDVLAMPFTMGGYWTVALEITCPSVADRAVFDVCVES